MPINENKIIKLSIGVLFLSLLMVYLLLYQTKGDKLKQAMDNPWDTSSWASDSLVIKVNSWNQSVIVPPSIADSVTTSPVSQNLQPTPSQTPDASLSNIHMLSGTKLYYGKIDAIEKLGIKYQYALLDSTWTLFINLWTPADDFDTIARSLQGNLYKVTTEQEMQKNKLFGDKVTYINIPEYNGKEVFMLVYIKKEVRLIQIEYKIYHQSKAYLKSLFID